MKAALRLLRLEVRATAKASRRIEDRITQLLARERNGKTE